MYGSSWCHHAPTPRPAGATLPWNPASWKLVVGKVVDVRRPRPGAAPADGGAINVPRDPGKSASVRLRARPRRRSETSGRDSR